MVWSSRTSCNASRTSSSVAENSLVIPGPNGRSLEGQPARELGEEKPASRRSTRGRKAILVREWFTPPRMTTSRIPPEFGPILFVPSGSRPKTRSPVGRVQPCTLTTVMPRGLSNPERHLSTRVLLHTWMRSFDKTNFAGRIQTQLAGLWLIPFFGDALTR